MCNELCIVFPIGCNVRCALKEHVALNRNHRRRSFDRPVMLGLGYAACVEGGMTYERQWLGEQGESIACEELEKRGYVVLERRYRTRFGEIDVIASDQGTIVFVEVKTKTDCSFSDPVESVTQQKQRRLVSMAEQYVAYKQLDTMPCRFDVVAVDASVAPLRITIYKDAFRPGW